jgi:exo-beta-1,3-glucanase (GH17 family)
MTALRRVLLAVSAAATALAVAPPAAAASAPRCTPHAAAAPAIARLREALRRGRFVAYQPTSLQVLNGRMQSAEASSIRADLSVLRRSFDGLVTYDAVHGAQAIPPIAAALKFRALIIGVWNPADEAELDAAVDAARRFPRLIVGISLGNELLFSHRNDPATLAALIGRLRSQIPATPLSTTEPFHVLHEPDAAQLLAQLDFLLVNVHPIFQPWFHQASDETAAQFVVNVLAELAPLACGPILVKETGLPSAPESSGFGEARQASFYRELRRLLPPSADHAFAYFAAFDAPWRAYDALAAPDAVSRAHPEEAHWGLYDASRRPKTAVRELPPLAADTERTVLEKAP